MPHVTTSGLDLKTARPFGPSRWMRTSFANYVVELREGGFVGRGEAAPSPRFGEGREQGEELLAGLAPEIADADGPAAVEAVCDRLAGPGGRQWPALRAGLSAAAWDLAGLQAGEPVWRMLGLQRPVVRTSLTVSAGAPEDMLAQARAAGAFRTLKIKLGFDGDLDVAEALVRELPEKTFRFDVDEGWDRERAARGLERLAALGAELVEQPLPAADLDGVAWLRERSGVPLYADEALLGLPSLDDVAHVYDGVVVKLAKAGGIAAAFALLSACAGRGLPVLLGCLIESSLGVAAGLQLAGLAEYVDLDGALLLACDPFTGVEADGDVLSATDAPGLGARPADAA